MRSDVRPGALSDDDLAVDHELADIALGFRFLLDLTPIDLVEARQAFDADGTTPPFRYRPLEDDPALAAKRVAGVAVDQVADPTLASLLLAKQRELQLQLEMLACRGSEEFLGLSIELYGMVSASLLREARSILADVPPPEPDPGPWLDARGFAAAAQAEVDHYRAQAPDIEAHVDVREGSTGVMVSNGDVLVAPTVRISEARVDALLQHEVGTHVVTHVNGAHQPLHVLASGLAGHEETQEGLAVLAEHLVGGLTAGRLRQLAARVVAVHAMAGGASFAEVHRDLLDADVPRPQAFSITMRVFRSGGLTKDAVYLRGLRDLVDHLGAGGRLEALWLGKMPLTATPLVEELHQRGALRDPLLLPRYLDDPAAVERLAHLDQVSSLAALIGDPA
jgi:uncharacterized protein (TIGR02421 family)